MKTTLFLLFLLTSFLSDLVAKELRSISSTPEDFPSKIHHGAKRHGYPIGSETVPVTVHEYCLFLQSRPEVYSYYSSYYDDLLMNPSSPSFCIIVNKKVYNYGNSYKHYKHGYALFRNDYSVREGCDDMIIDTLNSFLAQQEFNEWREKNQNL